MMNMAKANVIKATTVAVKIIPERQEWDGDGVMIGDGNGDSATAVEGTAMVSL